MNVVEIIKKKRDGKSLIRDEINFIVNSFTKNEIPEYQMSAFLMAGWINGFSKNETAFLTEAMLYSGKVVDLSNIKGKKIDKHSTGGVGDKTSLILAPIVAASGVKVPMISGRGLGHTGGTLDKLEAIPGFNTQQSLSKYIKLIEKHNLALIGQTKEIAPADKRIYSLRDVTGTIESIPLITASIMSKKLAEGADGFVLDVKTGSGAFMKKEEDSKLLAESLVSTAKKFKKSAIAYITDMNSPLGNYIGNWLEVYESLLVLQGENVPRLTDLSLLLAGAMIKLGGKAKTTEEGIEIAKSNITNGKAFDKFLEITKAQGGNIDFLKKPESYPKSKFTESVTAGNDGFISSIDNYEIGMASLETGAGRLKITDVIDPKAGIIFRKQLGDKINKGEIIAEIYTDNKKNIEIAKKRIINSISINNRKPKVNNLIKMTIE